MIPTWLTALSWLSLGLGLVTALWIAADVLRRPPAMTVMALVWPITALFGHIAVVAFYLRHGRAPEGGPHHGDTPLAIATSKGALHCGAGCTLGDIMAEPLAALAPSLLVAFGWPGLWPDRIFAIWCLDFVLAFAIGIAFQYLAIAPMRGLGLREGLIAALKADTLSLASWQIGMYGLMAVAHFWFFKRLVGTEIGAGRPEFWFAMQFAMIAGFCTAWPVNLWLIRMGIKERM